MAVSGGLYGLSKQIHYEQAAENHAQEYAHYAREKAEQPCRILPSGEQARCLADAKREQENQAREKRREYDDLVAQQTSALWTNIMGLAAITGMILSVIGVWLVFATFRETRRTANEAQRSVEAFIASERGWLKHWVRAVFRAKDTETLGIMISGVAAGKAQIDVGAMHWGCLPDGRYPRDFNWEIAQSQITALDPNAVKKMAYPIFKIDVPRKECIIGGWIEYRTQFPGLAKSHFLFQLHEEVVEKDGSHRFVARDVERFGWPQDT